MSIPFYSQKNRWRAENQKKKKRMWAVTKHLYLKKYRCFCCLWEEFMNVFEAVKQSVSTRQAADMYVV